MAGKAHDYILDNGLVGLKATATHIYLCSQEPASYAEATTTYALANKSFGAGNVFTGPTARGGSGRKLTTVAVTDGSVTGSASATRWAIVNSGNSRLLLDNNLSAPQALSAGNIWSMPSFDFGVPGV